MSTRDRMAVGIVAGVAALAGFWFLILGPKRDEASKLNAQVTEQHARLDQAKAALLAAEAAKARYGDDYAMVARLGKAVTEQDDVASLVYQIESVAKANKIDFRSIKLESAGAAAPAAAPPAAQPPAAQVGQAGAAAKEGSSANPAPAASATPAPATALGVANLPPGAAVGPAGFPLMPFSFNFEGSFFRMEDFLRSLDGFTQAKGDAINVRGRLLTIDSITIGASRKGFPDISAQIKSNAFLLPSAEGLTGGATAEAPSSAAPANPATPTAGAGAPTTTAAVTGVTP